MDDRHDLTPRLDWGIVSDTLGALSLAVLFVAALAAPHLF